MGRRGPEKHKQSLADDIVDPASHGVRTKPRGSKRPRGAGSDEDEAPMPGVMSSRILKAARAQQEAVALGTGDERGAEATVSVAGVSLPASFGTGAYDVGSDSDGEDGWEAAGSGSDADGTPWADEEVSPEDEAALAAFMNPDAANYRQRTLADVIADKIREKAAAAKAAGPGPADDGALDAKMAEVFKGVGALLRRYTTGKVPRAFKIIPTLRDWEEALFLTEPEAWSPHAVYAATRIFVSSFNARLAQRFLSLVLLPAVRRDIAQNRRLHFALFQALKRSTFKAPAFFKGVLLPLCTSGSCTLREAVILSSVLRRTSLPVLHAGAALLRIADMPYSGTNSFFMRVLLDKRYALPYRVVDAVVDHFTRFATEERQLPVVWHHALLAFVQRYKNEIRQEDRAALRTLLRAQHHYLVTPEIVRELDAGRARGAPAPEAPAAPAPKTLQAGGEDPRALAPLVLMDE